MTTLHESPLQNANAPRSFEERRLCLATTANRSGLLTGLSQLTGVLKKMWITNRLRTVTYAQSRMGAVVRIRSGLSLSYAMAGTFISRIEPPRAATRAFGQRQLAGLEI